MHRFGNEEKEKKMKTLEKEKRKENTYNNICVIRSGVVAHATDGRNTCTARVKYENC
jgi:hypothetical protein